MPVKRFLLLVPSVVGLLVAAPRSSFAQERGAVALGDLVGGLGVSARVLIIGAHPDDEDTRLIAYLARGRHVQTAYLSLTRGDGGQNLIGNELGEALGVIRTEELLAARRLDGGHQYFTRAYDYGFSKSAAEAFSHWPHDSVLKDVVTVVRAFRPHVIVAIFSGTPRDGHGQHQVSGILAREAFDAAADSVKFPRAMTAGQGPWTPLKFYRSAGFSGRETATLAFNVGEYNALLGRSYAEIASLSRSQHKSQGMGGVERKGVNMDYVKREVSRVPAPEDPKQEKSLFDGIDTTWARLKPVAGDAGARAALDSLPAAITQAQRTFNVLDPATVVAPLVRVKALIDRLDASAAASAAAGAAASAPAAARTPGSPDLQRSAADGREQLAWAITLAAGVALDATVDRDLVAQRSDSIAVTLRVFNRGPLALDVPVFTVRQHEQNESVACERAQCPVLSPDSVAERRLVARGLTTITQPWWLVTPRVGDLFTQPIGPLSEDERARQRVPGAATTFDLRLADGRRRPNGGIELLAEITDRYADPVRGQIDRPLAVAPGISVTLDRVAEYAPANTPLDRAVHVNLRSAWNTPHTVRVSLKLPRGLTADSATHTVTLARAGATSAVEFRVLGRLPAGRHEISAVAESAGETFTIGYVPIEYGHIRPQKLYRDATLRLESVDIKLPPKLTVAYIPGVGDNVAPMLEQLGVPVTVLDPAKLASTDLSRFSTVVVGTRAYEADPSLVADNGRLLEYAKRGGTLVVQYGQYEMAQPGIMPYPITLTRPADRVTDENAPVTILRPDSPLLTTPNRITQQDFAGWVQERSLYMPHTFDQHYTPLLSMNDPGEPPNAGAILVAPYGRGTYVYTTLSLFRQLPAGNPGAARLFANLLGARAGKAAPETLP